MADAAGEEAARDIPEHRGEERGAGGSDVDDEDRGGRGDAADRDPAGPPAADARPLGRLDLSQDAIQDLRARRRQLKLEQRRLRNEERNAQRKRARIMKKLKNLDTSSVTQVLIERGLDLQGPHPAAAGGAAGAARANP